MNIYKQNSLWNEHILKFTNKISFDTNNKIWIIFYLIFDIYNIDNL